MSIGDYNRTTDVDNTEVEIGVEDTMVHDAAIAAASGPATRSSTPTQLGTRDFYYNLPTGGPIQEADDVTTDSEDDPADNYDTDSNDDDLEDEALEAGMIYEEGGGLVAEGTIY